MNQATLVALLVSPKIPTECRSNEDIESPKKLLIKRLFHEKSFSD